MSTLESYQPNPTEDVQLHREDLLTHLAALNEGRIGAIAYVESYDAQIALVQQAIGLSALQNVTQRQSVEALPTAIRA